MIILASGSPRRKELMTQAGFDYIVVKSDAEEVTTATEPTKIVEELSLLKAKDVYNKVLGGQITSKDEKNLLVAADTLVFLDDKVMGKPHTPDVARKMISDLSGRTHHVITGVTLFFWKGNEFKQVSFAEKTEVKVAKMTEAEIDAYANCTEPLDKAGAYAIQGFFGKYVESINGEYANVVGLPIARVYKEIKNIGFFD